MSDISKIYDASKVEDEIYKAWEKSGFFNPDNLPGARKESFTISMPPPNATGILHIGHAMFLTIQDVVIRFQRMRGKKTLWLPGTDHAAIATNAKVEKILLAQGKTKHDIGRDAFLKRVDAFVRGSRVTIQKQVRKMGASCDWSREHFTLDNKLSSAVKTAFVRMYEDGLIYRGNRIVNWCPHCESTLSDDEVLYKEEKTKFYYFRYGPVVIGTARPETKFLDKTIIVHPKDKRYKNLVGKEFMVEWIDGRVKANVIADSAIDMNFGSGAMTITPAHSFEDFELAQKYKLPIVKIIDEKGNFTKAAGVFAGKNARTSRDKIVNIFEKKGLIEKIDENYSHNLSVCYRCGTTVEPLTKEQWFVDVKKELGMRNKELEYKKSKASLKDLALHVVKSGQIKFIPKRFEKIYYHWMENLRDWCISRQIWYGHRIPVWYCVGDDACMLECKNPIVSAEEPKKCPHCGSKKLRQDPDTLDTWFSSGLWTFSTLGWPTFVPQRGTSAGKSKKTGDLKTFHPTSLMETGYDIIFFWVARMILMSVYHMKEVPFREVYLHGLVRDEQGRKMSKSLDNIIDPLDLIPKYGTDAIRLSLVIGTTPGNDLNLGETKIQGYRNFVNKLWNISRYILMSVEPRVIERKPKPQTLADTWILSEFDVLISAASELLEKYQFSQAGEMIYEFTWSKFADWYIEISKLKSQNSKRTDEILNYILQNLLKLWHPFCPFITEEIWKNYSKELLIIQPWPKVSKEKSQKDVKDFELIQTLVVAIRNFRAQYKIPTQKKISIVCSAGKQSTLLKEQELVLRKLASLENIDIKNKAEKEKGQIGFLVSGIWVYVDFFGIIDVGTEKKKTEKDIKQISEYIGSVEKKLLNENFTKNAPEAVVEKEKTKLKQAIETLNKLKKTLENFEKA